MTTFPAQKTGILLVNLGSPATPKTSDVRRYLRQFLMDSRVIDINPASRFALVQGVIAPFRAPKSAKLYKAIWTREGSPLVEYGRQAARLLQNSLGDKYVVQLAMRYQKPSIQSGLEKLRDAGVWKIRIVTFFPHYASASTGSVHEEVMRVLHTWPIVPVLEFVHHYPDNALMVVAFAQNAQKHDLASYDHILFSYHGLPERQLVKADRHNWCMQNADCCQSYGPQNASCYSAQCYLTTREIASHLGLDPSRYTVCFQSRLGRTEWKKPYTTDVIEGLAAKGAKRLLVLCPAFTADCLETIYEVGVEYDELFKEKRWRTHAACGEFEHTPAVD